MRLYMGNFKNYNIMKRKVIILVSGLLFGTMGLSAQSWDWAVEEGLGAGTPYSARPLDMDAYSTGAYIVGSYRGTPTFGAVTLANSGSSDGFLCKMTIGGSSSVSWTVRAAGANADAIEKLLVVGSDVIVAGGYSGSVTLGTTSGSPITLTGGSRFLARYNTSGVLQWAVNTTGTTTAEDMASDGGTNQGYAIGRSSASINQIVVTAFDLSTGASIWSQTSSSPNFVSAGGVGADNAGNCYVLVAANAGFGLAGSGTISFTGQDLVLMKLNSAGNYVSHLRIGGAADELGRDLDCTTAGDIYITGYYENGATDMDGSGSAASALLPTSSGADLFFAKYNSSLTFQWTQRVSGPGNDIPLGMDISGSDGYLVVQNLSNAVTLTGVCGSATYDNLTDELWYLVKYEDINTGSPFIDWSAAPESGDADAMPVAIAVAGTRALVAGFNEGTTTFGPYSVSGAAGSGSIYFAKAAKVACRPSGNDLPTAYINEKMPELPFRVYPNPGNGIFHVDMQNMGTATLEIFDLKGQRMQQTHLQKGTVQTIDLSHLAKGIYVVNVRDAKGKIYSQKVVLQ